MPPLGFLLPLSLVLLSVQHAHADLPWITDYDAFNAGVYGEWPTQRYYSSDLISPHFLVNTWNQSAMSNRSHIFMAPSLGGQGATPFIFSSKDLSLVYADPRWNGGSDTKLQFFDGKPYISFWSGVDFHGHGTGGGVMLNSSYGMEYNLTVNGIAGGADSHEFQLTDDGGALINNYHTMVADVSSVGGPNGGKVLTGSFQEIDIKTGWVRFQWNALDHFEVAESKSGYSDNEWGWDWFHMNSIQKTLEGNYLISSRHLCMIALINGTDGNKIWQIGGVKNDFTDLSEGRATNFAFQHNARFMDANLTEITLFDNQATWTTSPTPACDKECSRGLRLKIDTATMTVRVLNEFYHPKSVQAWAEGGIQALEGGNFMVGFGVVPTFMEYTETGEVAMEVQTRPWSVTSGRGTDLYRVYKFDWEAQPPWKPSLVEVKQSLYVSWNGATEVEKWALYGGTSPDNLKRLGVYAKMGFETAIRPFNSSNFYQVAALDGNGKTLDASEILEMYQLPCPVKFDIKDPVLVGIRAFPFAWAAVMIIYMATTNGYIRLPRRRSRATSVGEDGSKSKLLP
ncbi:arylsulfotransferase protein [Rutstroemia sp. NJR-2017a BVV2]|nr:arylsulfotransferase protein [Rutstroemia sp. NJR-2017a BVV2]